MLKLLHKHLKQLGYNTKLRPNNNKIKITHTTKLFNHTNNHTTYLNYNPTTNTITITHTHWDDTHTHIDLTDPNSIQQIETHIKNHHKQINKQHLQNATTLTLLTTFIIISTIWYITGFITWLTWTHQALQ